MHTFSSYVPGFSLVLIVGFRAWLAGLTLGYPENPLLNPENQSKLGSLIFSYVWVWAGLAGFWKIMSWV